MRVTILAYGTRGDVQPYVALGLGLQRAGHTVRVAAPAPFEAFVRERGLDFAPIAGDPAEISRALVDQGQGHPLKLVAAIIDLMRRLAVPAMLDAQAACHDADAILHSLHMAIPGHTIARMRGVRSVFAQVYPICAPTSAFPSVIAPELPLGRAYNRLSHAALDQVIWQTHRLLHWRLKDRHPDLPPRLRWPFDERPATTLFGFSPHVIAPPPDWAGRVHVTGYWFLDTPAGWQPPGELQRFLETGPPPIYIGFGSMITRHAAKLTGLVLEAIRQAGQRAILLEWPGGGATSQAPRALDARTLALHSAPHDWLFPRMAAVAHHGGAGTTAAGLRAGAPSILIPFSNEQPFWGRHVHRLGVGPKPIPIAGLTAEKLAEAIRQAVGDPATRERAAALGAKIRAEDGVARAVEIVEAAS